MPVKKRTAVQIDKTHNLRHPLLKHGSAHLLLYNYIKQHPGSVTSALRAIYPSGQPLTDMVNEGLIRSEGARGSTRYWIIPENETGQGRDLVEVKLTLFRNKYGEYSIKADLVGQHLTAHEDFPQPIYFKTVRIRPPRPEEPTAVRPLVDVNDRPEEANPPPADPSAGMGDLIIETDYRILPPNK